MIQKEAFIDTEPPYWAQVWPAARALAAFMAAHPQYVKDQQVVELGAGLGLPSLVAARFAKNVLTTDISGEAVQCAALSAEENGFTNMETAVLDWSDYLSQHKADVVLLSDVNYDPQVFPLLQQLLLSLLRAGTTILLSTPQRLVARQFVQPLLSFVSQQENSSIEHAGGMVDTTVFVLQGQGG